jgi:hypothetical protein
MNYIQKPFWPMPSVLFGNSGNVVLKLLKKLFREKIFELKALVVFITSAKQREIHQSLLVSLISQKMQPNQLL